MSYKSLEDKVEKLPHHKLYLTDNPETEANPHRPELSVWAECEIGDRPLVSFGIGPLWAQPSRYLDLTPAEARELARLLIATADSIDETVDNHEPPDPPGFEAGFASNH